MMGADELTSILVTGGTGSFGNAFVRRCLARGAYERICIYSRDELKQSQMRATLAREYPDAAERVMRYFLGDVRDEKRLVRALVGIDAVVHAAALKQVPFCEYNPAEAVKTNIGGALNLIEAAIAAKVKKVLALSSDKAVSPINLYGRTKAVAESLFTQANVYSPATRFACVRYGNVFASRGSVIPLWEQQLARDGEIQITDAQMTRFYMTLDEACELVEAALMQMVGGEVFVPKVRSFSLGNLAAAWNAHARQRIIGIRPGEKMHEQLISEHEAYRVLDQGTRYVVLPTAREWMGEIHGEPVPRGFYYASNHNQFYIHDTQEIREWLREIG